MVQRVYSGRRKASGRRVVAQQSGSAVGIPGAATGGAGAYGSTFGSGAFQTGGTAHVPGNLSPTGSPVTGASGGTITGWQSPQGAGPSSYQSTITPPYQDPHAMALKGFAETTRDNAYADLAQQAGYAQADYGYTGQDTNGDGIPDAGFTVDPSNPFSKAALLQKAYDQNVRGTKTNYAAQGQLYSGALQNAQNENTFQNQQATNANLRDFQRVLEALSRGRRDAGLESQQAVADIDWQALLAAVGRPA